ncbi:MAG: citramalate synthase [Candidatus Gastranaerophilaceae bacterium]|jgi:2-isopropylmalate synthase
MSQKIEIYDTTLRDGAQAEGISFSVSDKIKIITLLDELGVDYIEAGWPGSNPKDIDVFKIAKNLDLKNAVISAFGCTRKANTLAFEDKILKQLLDAETQIVTIFGKSWDFHVEHALCTTLEENLNMIKDSVKYLIAQGRRVFFDAEHFFDGYKNNPEYALLAVKIAYEAGAERIILCDTNGGCINTEIYKITKIVKSHIPDAFIGIHAHNDSDMAVANSIESVEAGVIQIQGTINGYGERCGNANLCSIIPNLQLKMNKAVLQDNLEKLVYVSRQIAEIANKKANDHAPYVGKSAFAHKAGIHASGVSKNSDTYEHISPAQVGNTRRILVSDQAGGATIREKIKHLRLGTEIKENDIPQIIEHIKKLEWQGFAFEDADASFEMMILGVLNQMPQYFELMGFRVIGDTILKGAAEINSEASVKIRINDEIFHTVSEGDGPVHALDMALRKALISVYPLIKQFKLSDFKVRILDSADGTGAKTRVHVETSDGYNRWDTVGVSSNVIEASYLALVDSISFGLLLHKIEPLENLNKFIIL